MQNTFKSVLLSTLIAIPGNTSASDSLALHTHTYTPIELKLVSPSFLYKTAAICFLGNGCGNGQYNKSDENMNIDTAEMCKRDGYSVTACTAPKYPFGQCPHNPDYYADCREDKGRACKDAGYSKDCGQGTIADSSQACPYDSSYTKCKCDPCEGYNFSYAEATTEGYEAGTSCNSCGSKKYQRQNAACSGFLSCECGGEIGTASCKSGTNTLFSSCKECIKCDDECPSGYYKSAGNSWTMTGNGISEPQRRLCSFETKTTTTKCGTTCYQCQPPEKQFTGGEYCHSVVNNCPEGYTINNETHDYTCNSNTCLTILKKKYPGYFFDEECRGKDSSGKDYQFDRPYVGCPYANAPTLFSKDIISQSFYNYADFKDEISQCKEYCRSGQTLINKTLKGNNLFLSLTYGGSSRNITVDGSARVPYINFSYGFDINGLVLKQGSTFENSTGHMDNVTLYPSSTLIGGKLGLVTIAANTASTPVTLRNNLQFSGVISSANYLSGTTGNFYLNIEDATSGLDSLTINRNPGGQIIVTPTAERGHVRNAYLFKNPGIDTKVILPQISGGRTCLKLKSSDDHWICSNENSQVTIAFKTDNVAEQKLPKCCSGDSGCPESQWNGKVTCTGKSYCDGNCTY